jgi:hypothetical protein
MEDRYRTKSRHQQGSRQGCLLSPLLFLLVLDGVLRRALDGKNRGLTWRLKETLEGMEYADDMSCISQI